MTTSTMFLAKDRGLKQRENLYSYLDIEAKTSVFIRSHLDQDQIIVRDNAI